jgi:hypothetical protein
MVGEACFFTVIKVILMIGVIRSKHPSNPVSGSLFYCYFFRCPLTGNQIDYLIDISSW